MLFGAQVKQAGGFVAALRRGEAMGAEVVQLFAQSPRQWKPPNHSDEVFARFAEARQASEVVRVVVCHAPYLVNLANTDEVVRSRSSQCLADNLVAAGRLGAIGLVLHVGSHLGAGLDAAVGPVARSLLAALDRAATETGIECPILLENTAGAGGTIGRTFDELASVIEAAGGDERLGVCLDTQHLWASGVDFSTLAAADQVVDDLDGTVGLERLGCLHVNDSKVPLGANRDRHENIGEGTMGPAPFRSLLGHPRLQRLPAVLEIAGLSGDGAAAEDLERVRTFHREGLAAWRRRDRRRSRRPEVA